MNKQILFTPAILGLIFSACNNKAEVKKTKPNILFILADDLGYHDLSVTGSKYYETPNIDQIAHDGTMFTNGYSNCQVCSPSRASILTGKSAPRHGITDWIGAPTGEQWRKAGRFNKLLPPPYQMQLEKNDTTIADALKKAGYKTFFAGKWHLGGKGSLPTDHGFDINIGGWEAGSPMGGYFAPWENPYLKSKQKGENLTMRLAQETASFMESNRDKPFFAYLSFYAVHGPIETSKEKWQKYRDKAEKLGIATSGYKMGHFLPIRQTQDNPVYAGLIESMDDAVGLVLQKLKELGLDKNTIVIFTSDNGGVSAGDSYSTSNLPLRGGKGYQFEGGIREPYFIKVPWMKNQPREVSTPVWGADFFPTLLDLAGLPLMPLQHADGKSLKSLLEGSDSKSFDDRYLVWHYPHYGNQGGEPSSMIRYQNWKLIHYYEDNHDELYDLSKDEGESNDLAATNKEMTSELHQKLFEYLNSVHARFPKNDPEYDVKKEKKYLEGIKTGLMPKLEKQRMNFLSKDFDPKNNWWDSEVRD